MPSIADLADGDGPPCTENALLVSLRFVWKEIFLKIIKNYKISHFFCSLLFNPYKTYTRDKSVQGLRNPPHIECWNDKRTYIKKILYIWKCAPVHDIVWYKIKLTFKSSVTSTLPHSFLQLLTFWCVWLCDISGSAFYHEYLKALLPKCSNISTN